jgi:hypothetical protein
MHGHPARREGPRGPHAVAESMKGRYGLNDQQTRQVEAILQRRRPRVDSLMAAVRPQLRAAYDSTNAEIRQVLTPGQRVKFDEYQERRRHGLDRWTGQPRGSPSRP